MRLEIVIPDSTRPDIKAKIASLMQRLIENPELIEEIRLDEDEDEDAAIQRLFTPERLATIAAAEADVKAGNFLTMEQVREGRAQTRAAWIAANPQ